MDVPPNQTIYINNLNEKTKKEDLKKSLYAIFSQFGTILDIVALKTLKMRGQAFVVFRDINSATNALRSMQGFPFYDKPMRICYCKSKSDAVAKLEGSYIPRDKKRKAPEAKKQKGVKQLRQSVPIIPQGNAGMAQQSANDGGMVEVPNKILFLSNLPEEMGEMGVTTLFQPCSGFKEVRCVPGRKDIAFVEFDTIEQARSGKDTLQGFNLTPTQALDIKFARQ